MSENTIRLSFRGIPGVEVEGIAGEDLMPGMLAMRTTGNTYIHHWLPTITALVHVVVEDPYQGGYGKHLDDADYYPEDSRVYLVAPRDGDVMWMWLAADTSIGEGGYLASDGFGYLTPISDPSHHVIGAAQEAVTTTTSIARIKVEIA